MKKTPSKEYALLQQKIFSLREEINHSQAALGDVLDIGQPAYEQKENGKTYFSVEDLFKLSKYYEICILELFRDHISEQEFSDYVASQGYILKDFYERKIDTLQDHNCSLEEEVDRLRAVNQQLVKDKALLADVLKNITGIHNLKKGDYKKL